MPDYGHFSENPQTEWVTNPNGEDRDMVLLRDFWYVDPDGTKWKAPKDSRINGASIPRPLWSTVGSPYTDDYRNASIVHDVACDKVTAPAERKAADKMFYYACLAGGCSPRQARLLYLGVRIGAWGTGEGSGFTSRLLRKALLFRTPGATKTQEEVFILGHYSRIAQKIEAMDSASKFEEVEALVDRELPVEKN